METTAAAGRPTQRIEQIMGMPIIIDIRDADIGPEAYEEAFNWFRFVDATFSTYMDDSEISRLNCGKLTLAGAHPAVREVLDACESLRKETQGFFDMRAPYRFGIRQVQKGMGRDPVDPSGYVKGWSVDRAGQILEQHGARTYCIYAGGDIRVHGIPMPERTWRIGIQHPLERDKVAAVVSGTNMAIATSGAYEHGNHIVDPRTGRIPTGVLSVTITGPDLARVDAYATAAFAMGEAGPAWTSRLSGYEAMTILSTHQVLYTPGFPSE